jgi:hypothetical protein
MFQDLERTSYAPHPQKEVDLGHFSQVHVLVNETPMDSNSVNEELKSVFNYLTITVSIVRGFRGLEGCSRLITLWLKPGQELFQRQLRRVGKLKGLGVPKKLYLEGKFSLDLEVMSRPRGSLITIPSPKDGLAVLRDGTSNILRGREVKYSQPCKSLNDQPNLDFGRTTWGNVLRGEARLSSILRGEAHLSSILMGEAHLSSILRGEAHLSSVLRGEAHLSSVLRGEAHLSNVLRGEAYLSSVLRGEAHLRSVLRGEALQSNVLRREALQKSILRGEALESGVLRREALQNSVLRGEAFQTSAMRGEVHQSNLLRGEALQSISSRGNTTTSYLATLESLDLSVGWVDDRHLKDKAYSYSMMLGLWYGSFCSMEDKKGLEELGAPTGRNLCLLWEARRCWKEFSANQVIVQGQTWGNFPTSQDENNQLGQLAKASWGYVIHNFKGNMCPVIHQEAYMVIGDVLKTKLERCQHMGSCNGWKCAGRATRVGEKIEAYYDWEGFVVAHGMPGECHLYCLWGGNCNCFCGEMKDFPGETIAIFCGLAPGFRKMHVGSCRGTLGICGQGDSERVRFSNTWGQPGANLTRIPSRQGKVFSQIEGSTLQEVKEPMGGILPKNVDQPPPFTRFLKCYWLKPGIKQEVTYCQYGIEFKEADTPVDQLDAKKTFA